MHWIFKALSDTSDIFQSKTCSKTAWMVPTIYREQRISLVGQVYFHKQGILVSAFVPFSWISDTHSTQWNTQRGEAHTNLGSSEGWVFSTIIPDIHTKNFYTSHFPSSTWAWRKDFLSIWDTAPISPSSHSVLALPQAVCWVRLGVHSAHMTALPPTPHTTFQICRRHPRGVHTVQRWGMAFSQQSTTLQEQRS